MRTYAARIEDGTVTQVIVGDPAWAADRLGGVWLPSDVKVGVGWTVVDGGFRPPAPYPSWTWDGTEWKAPKRKPLLGGPYVWDEDTGGWVEAEETL